MPRLTKADLERALGGAHALVELLDFDGDGVADAASVNEILVEVDAEANSYIGMAVDVSDPSVATAPLLLMKEKDCGIYLCWRRGTRWQACPDEVKQAYQDALAWYEKVGARQAGLGNTTRPTSSQPVQQATSTADSTFYSENSPRQRFRGMW